MRGFDDYGSVPRIGKLMEIEPVSGFALDLGVLGGNAQVVGLYSVPVATSYTITLPNVTGATVIPEEGYTTTVAHGGKFMFTVAIEDAYNQSNYTVRANNIVITQIGGIFTINNIVRDQDITIENVTLNQYRIEARAYTGGTINPNGIFMVAHGSDKTFTIIPNTDFVIDRVEVNGAIVTLEENAYTLENITANATIEAYFKFKDGIDENKLIFSIFSYNNVVTIINKNLIPVKQVEIMDVFGRIIWQGQSNSERTEITLNNIAAGMYAVRVITGDHQQVITKISIN